MKAVIFLECNTVQQFCEVLQNISEHARKQSHELGVSFPSDPFPADTEFSGGSGPVNYEVSIVDDSFIQHMEKCLKAGTLLDEASSLESEVHE